MARKRIPAKGILTFYIGDSPYIVNGGDAFIVKPDDVHSTNEVPMTAGEICWIQLDISNLDEEITLDELASISCLSLSRFKHKFKSQIGMSPRNCVNQQKIEQIKQVLNKDTVLTQAVEEFGFCNSSYFSVVLKKYTGKTPADYVESRFGDN